MPITERAVLLSYLNQNLAQVYKKEKSEQQKFFKSLLDIFASFDLKIDLSDKDSKTAFESLVAKFKYIVKKYHKSYHSKKNELAAVESCVPDEEKLFYSKEKYSKLCFLQPAIDER